MNFKWREFKESDVSVFNDWHTYAIKNSAPIQDGISKYITPTNFLLGDTINEMADEFCDDSVRLYSIVSLVNNKPVGVVLYSKIKSENSNDVCKVEIEAIVSNPKLKGCGIGTAMIFDMVKNREKLFGGKVETIIAKIERSNLPSQKAFSNNNFDKFNHPTNQRFFEYKNDVSNNYKNNNYHMKKSVEETVSRINESNNKKTK